MKAFEIPTKESGEVVRYAFPGGYEIAYLDDANDVLCAVCVQNSLPCDDIRAAFNTSDSDSCVECESCGEVMGGYCDPARGEYSENCDLHSHLLGCAL
jgi:hypothetical protein